ncbi:MAG: MogA/MoaB family molybdenum cofactor biosynthesis protein [Microcoleaceae cyanobacterium]
MSDFIPHADQVARVVDCRVVTVSDTRSPETDTSGQLIKKLLLDAGHQISDYLLLPDEQEQVINHLKSWGDRPVLNSEQVIIFNGGTGIAPRDNTYDAIALLLEKTLPGFGEIFRYLSYQEIGSRAIASRAVAGVYRGKLIFSLPGSTKAVRLGMEKLILPELQHLVKLLND